MKLRLGLPWAAERIGKRFRDWQESGATGLTVWTDDPEAMELVAKLAA